MFSPSVNSLPPPRTCSLRRSVIYGSRKTFEPQSMICLSIPEVDFWFMREDSSFVSLRLKRIANCFIAKISKLFCWLFSVTCHSTNVQDCCQAVMFVVTKYLHVSNIFHPLSKNKRIGNFHFAKTYNLQCMISKIKVLSLKGTVFTFLFTHIKKGF